MLVLRLLGVGFGCDVGDGYNANKFACLQPGICLYVPIPSRINCINNPTNHAQRVEDMTLIKSVHNGNLQASINSGSM